MTEQNNAAAAGQQEFTIHKVYVKDVSFESPSTPQIFTQDWNPETNVQINTQAKALEEGLFDVELTLTVTAKVGEQTAYLVEIKQAGVFQASGFEDAQMGHLLGSYCPNLLFPYARAVVSSLVSGGGFPDLALAPINFDALYAQHVEQLNEQAGQEAPQETAH
jgi:preprotein translocase subunit SecB